MATPNENAKSALLHHIEALVREGKQLPWHDPQVVGAGVPRSGATSRAYSGSAPFAQWTLQSIHGFTTSQWFTAKAATRFGGAPQPDAIPCPVRGATVYNRDQLIGLNAPLPPTWPDTDAGIRRARAWVSFVGATLKKGAGGWVTGTDVIRLAPEADWDNAGDYWATVLHHLVRWTAFERRLNRNLDAAEEQLAAELGGAWLMSHVQLQGQGPSDPSKWIDRVASRPAKFWRIAGEAWNAVQYLLNLAHPDLLRELEASAIHGNAAPAVDAERSADLITSLGQILIVSDEDMAEDDITLSRTNQQPLILANEAGTTLRDFLDHFLGTSVRGRKRHNPPLSAWIAGGPGTGRNQVISALNALFRTGGTDLSGTLVATENAGGTLLEAIENVWSNESLEVIPCQIPRRVEVRHDRAIPTTCLRAFHVSRGLSPILWVARLEHRLIRSGEFKSFVTDFDERSKTHWRGDANRHPDRHIEEIIAALGGAEKGARRRVNFYRRTRASAGWEAFFDEAEYSIHHPRRHESDVRPDVRNKNSRPSERRIMFSIDLAPALQSSDPAALGWIRRCLSGVPNRMEDLSRPERRPFWFMFSTDTTLKELSQIVRWKPKARKLIKIHVDLDQHPVTAAFNHRLLVKLPAFSRPIYRLYAKHRSTIRKLSVMDNWRTPTRSTREQILKPFPFLPPVLPVAQAILDTIAADATDADASPLAQLIKRAIDEHFFAPPDRFIPLDVLLEPILPLLETASSAPAGIRIFVPTKPATADWRPAFTHEAILTTMRLVNRVRDFPATPENLVRLMFVRFDRPYDVLIDEVQDTLQELVSRNYVKRTRDITAYQWLRNI